MGRHADLRVGDEVRRVDLAELEEDVRRARVLADAELHHPPWTGETWRRIDAVPELAHALDTPDARLAAHLLRPRRAWLTVAVVVGLFAAAAAQFAAGPALSGDPALLHRLSVGWESTLLDGAWWSALSAPLLHRSFAHLLGNVVILAYCGWRCERAVGATGLAGVMAGATTGAALGVILASERGAIGASGVVFGVWGGQFAIGWRYGVAVPEPLRRYYGAGTAWVAAPLMAWSFLNPTVTFAGHLGGFVGGAVAVFLLPVATSVPPTHRRAARRSALAVAVSLLVVVPALSLMAPRVPGIMLYPASRVPDAATGLSILLPWRLKGERGGAVLPSAPGAPALRVSASRRSVGDAAPLGTDVVMVHGRDALEVTWDRGGEIAAGRQALYERIAASAEWSPPAWVRSPPGVATAAAGTP
jgi:membrane associated rhomboid family serine protease